MEEGSMKRIAPVFVLALTIAILGWSTPARAGLNFCNESGQQVDVAVAWYENNDWKSRGWFVLTPQECKPAVSDDLKSRYYWYYAESLGKKLIWSGKDKENAGYFCVTAKRFFFR